MKSAEVLHILKPFAEEATYHETMNGPGHIQVEDWKALEKFYKRNKGIFFGPRHEVKKGIFWFKGKVLRRKS